LSLSASAAFDNTNKRIYDYDSEGQNATIGTVPNISPYLVEGSDIAVTPRTEPLCDVPEIIYGSKPVEGGNLILSDKEKKQFLLENPAAARFVRPFIGSDDSLTAFHGGVCGWWVRLLRGSLNPRHQEAR